LRKRENEKRTIAWVTERGLCTSCGACSGICPEDAVRMAVAPWGTLEPEISAERCNECGKCFRVCPGHEIDIPYFQKKIFGRLPSQPEIGNYVDIYAGYTTDNDLRYHSQSGGLISSLLLDLLKRGRVDGAVVTRWKKDDPLVPETVIARDEKEILDAAKSKYLPVPAASILKELIPAKGRFAFVGVGCHIHAMRKAEEIVPGLRDKIYVYLGLHCLSVFNRVYLDYILGRNNVARDAVSSFEFRSKAWRGWPCDMRIESRPEKTLNIPGSISRLTPRPYFTPVRCVYCFDKLNELSDISFGDCRIPRAYGATSIKEVSYNMNPGISDIVCRSERGYELLKEAQSAAIVSFQKTSRQEILRTTKVSEKKLAMNQFRVFARFSAYHLPDYHLTFYPKDTTRKALFWLLAPASLISPVFFHAMKRLTHKRAIMAILIKSPHWLLKIVTVIREKMTNFNILSKAGLTVCYHDSGPADRSR